MAVNRKYLPAIIVFAVLLLLPFSVQTVADLQGDKRFVSFDIFKDIFYTPFRRETALNEGAKALDDAWRKAREAIAGGEETSDALEPVITAMSDLELRAMTVNAYAQLDTAEPDYKLLKMGDTLLSSLEDEPESFPKTDSCIKSIVANFSEYSLSRVFYGVKRYGAWSSRYLRAFEKKVEDENAMVLAFRPQYQRAVWNVFGDPGEKVVLGAKSGDERWLYYRQDVEFLVQPSPLDVRSGKLDNPIEAIDRFRHQLNEKGVELLVVVVPGKPSIYPERLTGKAEQIASHGKMILDSLNRRGFNTVDLYTPLRAAKVNDVEFGALYLNDDTHWTPRGAELAAKVIAEKVMKMGEEGLDLGSASMEFVTADSLADRTGDIGEMSGLNKFNVFKVQQVTGHVVYQQDVSERRIPRQSANDSAVAAAASTDSLTQDSLAQDSVVYDTSRTAFKDDFRKAKILILGDSFSRIYQTDAPVNAGWIAHFAKNMKRPVASIVSDGGASTLVREKLARKAGVLKGKKLLIWEFVERDLRFGAEGWKDVNF